MASISPGSVRRTTEAGSETVKVSAAPASSSSADRVGMRYAAAVASSTFTHSARKDSFSITKSSSGRL